jgi:hypothetical protein
MSARVALVAVLLCLALNARADQILHGHVPAAVTNLQAIGRLPGTNHLHLCIGLPVRNPQDLDDLLHRLYDPASPDYHQYLNPKQFTAQFGPSEADYQSLIAFAKSSGLAVTTAYANRMLLDVEGSVADIEKTFHITLRTYHHPRENRDFYAPDTEPTVSISVPILHVTGLDDFILPQPVDLHPVPLDDGAHPLGNGSFYGAYTSGDLRAVYAPGTPLDGTGQSVGILALDGYYTNDIDEYKSTCGLGDVTVTNVLLDGFSSAPGGNNIETALDIEMAMSIATNLASVIVYEANFGDSVLNKMAVDDIVKQGSSSWIWYASPSTPQELQELAAQGQVMFQASGDNGNWGNGHTPTPIDESMMVDVGGTVLSTTGPGGSWVSETTWQSSGGGTTDYSIPWWQTNVDMTACQGSTTQRNQPDVAMPSIFIFAVANNGSRYGLAGTSCSAPQWAGFTAVINQQAALNANPPVGFLSPAIYAIGESTNYNACFHDVTTGNNTNSANPTTFFAVPGYDLCTGWGTPNGTNLINALAPFNALRVTPVTVPILAGPIGGPLFGAQSFFVTNAATTALGWTLVNACAWLNVSSTGGSLVPGQTATFNAAVNSLVNFMPAGQYAADLTINNSAGVIQQRQVTLTINPVVQNGGFETSDFTGWTLTGTGTVAGASSQPPDVHSGNDGARLANVGSLGYLSQTFPTVPGGAYLLGCWLNSSANPNHPSKSIPNQFLVSWNGTTLFNQSNIGAIGWTNLQYIVTATGSNTTLQFGFRDDPWALGLDDITLQPIVPPAIQAVTKQNHTMNFVWGVDAGVRYQMQETTNLNQIQWINLGSPVTATNVLLPAADTNASGTQRFYRIIFAP